MSAAIHETNKAIHANPYWQMQSEEFKEKYKKLLLKKGANVVLYCQPNSDMKTPARALAYYLPQILDTLLEAGKRTFICAESSYKGKRDFFEQVISHLLSRKEQYPIKTIVTSRREFFSLYPCDDCLEMAHATTKSYYHQTIMNLADTLLCDVHTASVSIVKSAVFSEAEYINIFSLYEKDMDILPERYLCNLGNLYASKLYHDVCQLLPAEKIHLLNELVTRVIPPYSKGA